MSLRASASLPSSCSGAMYWKVPRMVPCCVRCCGDAIVGSDVAPEVCAAGARTFARPKSRSLAPLFVSMTFPGLRSRWTIPWRCALSSASAICIPIGSSWSSVIGPFARRAISVSPSISSIARTCRELEEEEPGISSNEKTAAMLGWFRPASSFASRSKRLRFSSPSKNSSGSTLSATVRPRRASVAR